MNAEKDGVCFECKQRCDEEEQRKKRCEETVATLLGIKTSEMAANWDEIEDMRIKMWRQMDDNPGHQELYLRLFTNPQAVRHYLNLKLAISTDERLQAHAESNVGTDFRICTLAHSNSHVQLLRQLITAFNHEMLPPLQLKSYNLTLKQAEYDENESIEIPDEVWGKLQHVLGKMRRPRPRPEKRRSLMDCIYVLSEHLFGKHFTSRKRTEKASNGGAPRNVYNYETDQVALGLVIKLMTVSHRTKLSDIEPELVYRYNLL
jgi:hypothetical protein